MLNILWSHPYTIKEGFATKWRREWNIPENMLNSFFAFWKNNRFKMLADGFTVIKSKHSGKWFLYETKDDIALFKSFEEKPLKPEEKVVLVPYKLKNSSGLRTWQIGAAEKLISAINYWGAAIDGSDCGVGKTYTACAVARELGYKIVVICPKAVIKSWHKVLYKHFKIGNQVIDIINYEKLRNGRKDSKVASYVLNRKSKREVFTWKIPKKTIIIFDESQKLKNWKTQNAKMCVSALKEGFPILFCSATNATNPLEMRAVGLAIKLFKNSASHYYEWAKDNGVYQGNWGLEFNNDPAVLKKLHKLIFEYRGVRLRRDTIPNFPDCEIIPEVYNMDKENTKRINQIYDDMEKELKKLEKIKKGDTESELTIRLRARQEIELIKVPLFVDMVEEAKEQGFSIVIFVNFTNTLTALSQRLGTNCIFDGQTPDKIRNKNVELFQNNDERVILINIQSGGAGLSLHDLQGNFPRMSIISPTYSPVYMRQALGRIWRDDAKTKCIQRIVCVANTVEEDVCRNVQQKLDNLDLLNDGDLQYGKNYEIISD